MMYRLKLALICSLSFSLVGCSTVDSGKEEANANKKIATAQINTQLGLAYLEKNDVQRAKQKLLTALNEAPSIPETWYSMAYFMETTGNIEEAKTDYLKA